MNAADEVMSQESQCAGITLQQIRLVVYLAKQEQAKQENAQQAAADARNSPTIFFESLLREVERDRSLWDLLTGSQGMRDTEAPLPNLEQPLQEELPNWPAPSSSEPHMRPQQLPHASGTAFEEEGLLPAAVGPPHVGHPSREGQGSLGSA